LAQGFRLELDGVGALASLLPRTPAEMADAMKPYLKKEKVLEHVGKIIDQVISEKPKDAYSLVEVLSRMVKDAAPAAAATETTPEASEALAKHVEKLRTLDKVPVDPDSGEPVAVCAISDFMEEAEILSWAGAGFSELESYKVMCSLRNLAAAQKDAGLVKLRFWGKIMGTSADYYVAEAGGSSAALPDDEPPATEQPGQGANAYVYFVTTDLCGSWVQLPFIRPHEIIGSRTIKKMATGDPQAKVVTHPFFEGREEVLLRAQIARITADTVLCIKGQLKREDDEDPASAIVQNEEFVTPAAAELSKKENWIHTQGHILKNGRTVYAVPWQEVEDDEENPGQKAKAQEEQEADPQRNVLRTCVEDQLPWSIKQAGDMALYRDTPSAVPRCNAVTYLRSLKWPGAVVAARGSHVVNLYVGYGMPADEPDFFPPAPPDVQDEPEDPGEEVEPQGSEEAPVADEA